MTASVKEFRSGGGRQEACSRRGSATQRHRASRCLLAVIVCGMLAPAASAGAASLSEFGRCLSREGAVFYGTSWCPYCKAQRQSLGAAMSHVRYVECAVGGERDQTAPACTSAGVRSYPTWVFGDGSRASGAQSLAALAAKTGCPLPEGSARSAKPSKGAAKGANPGPKIIEVPQ